MVREAYKAHGMVTTPDQDPVLRPHVTTCTSIHHHHQALGSSRKDSDGFLITEHERTRGQGMGRNWRELQHRTFGGNHRSASAKGIGRRPCRCRQDHSISGDINRCMPANCNFEMAHAGKRLTVQCHLIKRQGFPPPLVSAHHSHDHVGALLDRPAIGENLLESLIEVTEIGLCEKAEMAGVDRQNRHTNRRCLTGC